MGLLSQSDNELLFGVVKWGLFVSSLIGEKKCEIGETFIREVSLLFI
jgi:hypothetical protein